MERVETARGNLLTIEDVAARIGTTTKQARNMRQRGHLGHSDLRMAQRYIAHLGDDGARIAVALDSYGSAPGRDTGDTNSGPKES